MREPQSIAQRVSQAITPSVIQPVQTERRTIEPLAAMQHAVAEAPRAVTTVEARPIVSTATEVAAIRFAQPPRQRPVATVAAGTAGVVTRELVRTKGSASTTHSEPTRPVTQPPVMSSLESVQAQEIRALYAQSASEPVTSGKGNRPQAEDLPAPPLRQADGREGGQSPSTPVSEAVEGRSVVPAPVLSRVPLTEQPVRAMPDTKADYGWLAQELWHRIERLKRYPRLARMHGWEGKVVVRAVIKDDGSLLHETVEESSGHEALDQDALDLVKQACPLALKHALGQSQVVVHVPIQYRIEQ